MSCIPFYWLICAAALLLMFGCIPSSIAGNNETDKLALLEIKAKITHDPLGIMSSWNDTFDFCQWYGVTCSPRHPRVTELNLQSAELTGIISAYIGNLSFMQGLNLSHNSFGGSIPPEAGRLHRLQHLSLSHNSIGGEVPSNISRFSRLTYLELQANKLVGVIPPELGSLLNLQHLNLGSNNFTGTIPSALGNLSFLSKLHLAQTSLGGRIPDSLGRLKNLIYLSLALNYNLFGVIPPSIFNLSALVVMDVTSNQLEGYLPSDIGAMLPNLQFFSIGDNMFRGTIPASISNLSNLVTFELYLNKLQGQVPTLKKLTRLEHLEIYNNSLGNGDQATDLDFVYSMANLTGLQVLDMSFNNLSGYFPSVLCNFSKLNFLTVASNRITGEIPSCIENLINLQVIDAKYMYLFGAIPHSIGKLRVIYDFDLTGNQLSGYIPSSLGNLTFLSYFSLAENHLQGQIPSALGNCKNLLALDLSYNNLSGRIPAQVFHLSTLSVYLNLSNNNFRGPLSEEVGSLVNLGGLDISENLLSGEIPSSLGSCIGLQGLFLEGNFFRGVIPTTLSTLKGLQSLDLSRNNLSGMIPKGLQGLQLRLLNLSYNNLQGEVPTSGVFGNAADVSVVGNVRLCGGITELKLRHCNFSSSTGTGNSRPGHKNHIGRMGVLFGLSGFILFVACVLLYNFLYRKRTKKPTDGSSDLESSLANLSYQMLHRATNGFSSEKLIGSGAFGVVYQGTLDQDVTRVVAIKIFNLEHHGALKSFVAECEALRNIRHRNLIKVITACSSVDYQGNDFKALVYEYMTNGSLDDWLHPTKEISRIDNTDYAPRNLSLCQRLEIAVDVGFALEYLHYNSVSSVIHCDLKPSNVLLDEDMIAHVGDFGLAKIISQGSSENQSRSIGVRGTVGYAPPEYGMGNEVSMCGDVYSFGILLLEMFTGKRPTDNIFSEGMSLHNFVKAALSQQDVRIVDDALLQEMSTNDSNNSQIVLEAVGSVLELALTCSAELAEERPDMSEICGKLTSIRKKVQALQTRDRRGTEAGI